jgi:hypothetical protein
LLFSENYRIEDLKLTATAQELKSLAVSYFRELFKVVRLTGELFKGLRDEKS